MHSHNMTDPESNSRRRESAASIVRRTFLMFLLDTNVISELRVPKRADINVLAWASSQPLAA